MNKQLALEIVHRYLRAAETKMNRFGSALRHAEGRVDLHLELVEGYPQEHDFGWVFAYNTKQYIDTGDVQHALAGNAPLIVARDDGLIYVTGTALPIQTYLDDFKRGARVLAEPDDATERTRSDR